MKILLIQLRDEPVSRDHELSCILEKSALNQEDIVVLDVFQRLPKVEDLQGMDAVIIGGSGDYLVSAGDIPEEVQAVGTLITEARHRKIPLLGICFGAQIMAHTQGGRVELDKENQELGTFEIEKLTSAEKCPVFSLLPEKFDVQLGHKDHITVLPEGAINLAKSERSSVQAFIFPGEPTYALTFHPELDVEDIVWRLDYYAENYGLSKDVRDAIVNASRKAVHGTKPLQAFLDEVVEKGLRYTE